MKVDIKTDTDRATMFILSTIDYKFSLKLSKSKYPILVAYLKSNMPHSIITLNELGDKLLSLINYDIKGVYNGRDFLNILNIRWI